MRIITEQRTCDACSVTYDHTYAVIKGADVSLTDSTPVDSNLCDTCHQSAADKQEKADRMELYKQRYERHVPRKYRMTNTRHPDYPLTTTHEAALNWAKETLVAGVSNNKPFFGLQGPSELCKTRILAQMARLYISRGKTLHWINATEFESACQNEFDDALSHQSKAALRNCLKRDVLVLDDIGALKFTSSVERKLYRVLEERSAYGRIMLWSSNETFAQMGAGSNMTHLQKERLFTRLDGYSTWLPVTHHN